jgi:ribonuclease P protein component
MNRSFSLRRGEEFQAVWDDGKSWSHPLIILRARANGLEKSRFGFVAGKKVGGAVRRNRAKRLLREAVRHRLPMIESGWDFVFIARSSAEIKELDAAVAQLFKRARLIREGM